MKNPAFLVVVVLSLALGIAANSTIFSVLDTFLYRPLPYPHPEELVVVWETESAHPDRTIPPPIAELVDWQKQNHVFEDIALISFNDTASVSGLGPACGIRNSESVQLAGGETNFGANFSSHGSARSCPGYRHQRRVLEARAQQ
jgi:hypothetical protein